MNWLQAFNSRMGVITSLPKVRVFDYGKEVLDRGQTLTYFNLLQRLQPELLKGVYDHVESMYAIAEKYVGNWLQYQSLWDLQSTVLFDVLGEDLELWCLTLSEVKSERSTFDTTKKFRSLQAITIQYGEVQAKVSAIYDQWQRELLQQFSLVLRSSLITLSQDLVEARVSLENSATSATKDMIDLIVRVKDLNLKLDHWADKLKDCHDSQRLLERNRFQFPSDWVFYEQVAGEHSAFQEILSVKNLLIMDQKTALELRIKKESDIIALQTSEFLHDWSSNKPIGGELTPNHALLELKRFYTTGTAIYNQFKQIKVAKKAIDMPLTQTDLFEVVLEEIEDLEFVWNSLLDVWTKFEFVKGVLWLSEECWNVKSHLDSLLSTLHQMPNKVRQYVAYQAMLEKVGSSLQHHSDALALKSESLRERHWTRILSAAKLDVSSSALTVNLVWNSPGLKANEKTIEEIIFLAQGEMSLEAFLKQVRLVWDTCKFEFVNFQSKCRLVKGWDELFSKCQDHLSALSAMKNSVHYKAFKSSALLMEDSLSRLYLLLDVWVKVQRQWVYLQGIFNDNQEMKLLLPMESSRFASVDREFMAVLRDVYKTPLVLDAASIPNILKTMNRLHDLLNGIQKSLGEYLERERSNFARFYFISDDELLEILGNSKDLNMIEPHMKKMFSGISGLIISLEGDVIEGVKSKDGEQIVFLTPVPTKMRIYLWLLQLETKLKESLKIHLKRCLADSRMHYLENSYNTELVLEFVSNQPYQILLLASQIYWTEKLELSLFSADALKSLHTNVSDFIRLLSKSVVLDIDQFVRKKIEALITELVHQREVIRIAKDISITSKNDFYWLSHLRVYVEEENVVVKMGNSAFEYGFEYLGQHDKLVQTPLTDRCYLTLTQALHKTN